MGKSHHWKHPVSIARRAQVIEYENSGPHGKSQEDQKGQASAYQGRYKCKGSHPKESTDIEENGSPSPYLIYDLLFLPFECFGDEFG